MADETQPLKGNPEDLEEGKDMESPIKTDTFGSKLEKCTIYIFKSLYTCCKCIYDAIDGCCSLICYPIKDRCQNCCTDIDKTNNQYKDPAFTSVDI